MARPASRAKRLLGLCMLAMLCGCASPHEPRHERIPAQTQNLPVAPAETATTFNAHEKLPPDTKALPHTPSEPQSLRTTQLLHYAELYASLPSEAQHRAIAEAEIRDTAEQTPFTLVRYALLLALSEPDRQNDAGTVANLRDLLDLLTQPAAATDDKDIIPLAKLLAHILDERERLLAQNAELQRKLNQLKAIEQQLGDRVEPSQATP